MKKLLTALVVAAAGTLLAQTPAVPSDAAILKDDAKFKKEQLAAVYKADLHLGGDLEWEIYEDPAKNDIWKIKSFDSSLLRVKLEHDKADHILERSKAEFEIEALKPGTSVVEIQNGKKNVKIYVTVR